MVSDSAAAEAGFAGLLAPPRACMNPVARCRGRLRPTRSVGGRGRDCRWACSGAVPRWDFPPALPAGAGPWWFRGRATARRAFPSIRNRYGIDRYGIDLDLPPALPIASNAGAARCVRLHSPSERDDSRPPLLPAPGLHGAGGGARAHRGGGRAGVACGGRTLRGRGRMVRPGRGGSRNRIPPGAAPGARQDHRPAPACGRGRDRVGRRERARARAAVPATHDGGEARWRDRAGTASVGPFRRGGRRSARTGGGVAGVEQYPSSGAGMGRGRT